MKRFLFSPEIQEYGVIDVQQGKRLNREFESATDHAGPGKK